jgi:hypothetical protein
MTVVIHHLQFMHRAAMILVEVVCTEVMVSVKEQSHGNGGSWEGDGEDGLEGSQGGVKDFNGNLHDN